MRQRHDIPLWAFAQRTALQIVLLFLALVYRIVAKRNVTSCSHITAMAFGEFFFLRAMYQMNMSTQSICRPMPCTLYTNISDPCVLSAPLLTSLSNSRRRSRTCFVAFLLLLSVGFLSSTMGYIVKRL